MFFAHLTSSYIVFINELHSYPARNSVGGFKPLQSLCRNVSDSGCQLSNSSSFLLKTFH